MSGVCLGAATLAQLVNCEYLRGENDALIGL